MKSTPTTNETQGINVYLQAIMDLQKRVIESQTSILSQVAAQMMETIKREQRIFIFGTGHSHMLAEEAFFRAGGFASVVPIFFPGLMLHESPAMSSRLERTGGLASLLLDGYEPLAGEMLFIYSNSGVNQLPVEMALHAKERGLFVVSVSSLEYAKIAPLSKIGKRLDQVVDIAIDNGGQPGDALLELKGTNWRVGPSSTIIGVLIWNCLISETAIQLQVSGVRIPVFASYNMQDAHEHNQTLINEWRRANPLLVK